MQDDLQKQLKAKLLCNANGYQSILFIPIFLYFVLVKLSVFELQQMIFILYIATFTIGKALVATGWEWPANATKGVAYDLF